MNVKCTNIFFLLPVSTILYLVSCMYYVLTESTSELIKRALSDVVSTTLTTVSRQFLLSSPKASPDSFTVFNHCPQNNNRNSAEASRNPTEAIFSLTPNLLPSSNGVLVAIARSGTRFRHLQVPSHSHSSQGSFHRRRRFGWYSASLNLYRS